MAHQQKFEIVDGPPLHKLIDAMWQGEGQDIRDVTLTVKPELSTQMKKKGYMEATFRVPASVVGMRRVSGSTEIWTIWGGCRGIRPERTHGDATQQPFTSYVGRYSTRTRKGWLEPNDDWM